MTHEVIVDKLDKNFTIDIKVKISTQLKLRMFVALKLIRLAAFILNCGIKIEEE